MISRLKINDNVFVKAGKDRGKQGSVIAILSKKGKIMVKGVGIVSKHAKARRQGEVAEIKKRESFIDSSNVMPVCTSCHKPCRVSAKRLESGQVVRMCNRCKETF